MSDTKIPVKKLVNTGGNFYYPLTTTDAVVTSEGITVKNTIGSYRPNDAIPEKTSLKTILFRILTATGEADAVVHLSNIDIDELSDKSTRIPSSPLIAELLSKLEKKIVECAHYRGSVEYFDDLLALTPVSKNGDIYNVKYKGTREEGGTKEDGHNYIFSEETQEWDRLAGIVDLSNYYTKNEINVKFTDLRDFVDLTYVKKSDASGTVSAESGKCITGITQSDGKIVSVTSAKLTTDVIVTPKLSDGVKIADIKVDNTTSSIYAPKNPYTSGVIETWRDGYNWYRLYSDGWIEQGGIISTPLSSKSLLIPYHKMMKDSACSVQVTQHDSSGNDTIIPFKKIHNHSRIIVTWDSLSTPTFNWECKGYTPSEPVTYCTVTFDPNGGTVTETQRTVISGTTIGTLPIPYYEGYVFLGWFTQISGGIKVESDTIISNDSTFYANWISEDDILCVEDDRDTLVATEDNQFNIKVD